LAPRCEYVGMAPCCGAGWGWGLQQQSMEKLADDLAPALMR